MPVYGFFRAAWLPMKNLIIIAVTYISSTAMDIGEYVRYKFYIIGHAKGLLILSPPISKALSLSHPKQRENLDIHTKNLTKRNAMLYAIARLLERDL
ncbi:hypothetical protein K431DRAFT_155372 [Polychaeton citri CBS 116435]|uniref:Uncharacterized protein n=1 Tax=Polychaeton citri CBS 116435 TaxID=1314669 RepID=A0A9P4UTM8_9PEZI|nr:hypothetical protein K431DRAFT_155372 [Polychaeton citri CBS 116435]